ncbi:peptidase [Pacificimonas sp. WHA3]|uniref:Peptidase n=1 Tax=Pacificimonas pallii TaxID=2827236 RepID=A0ABS6SDD9_9SPHN|nr:peptidase [Pacificimonas pallii]MBV7256434.1 peptidase [Pacificimonas pallii]
MRVHAGLVMMADSRTNAGVDNISVYRKLHIYNRADRFVAICTAGSLSVTQAALSHLDEGLEMANGDDERSTIDNQANIFRIAQLIGRALHESRNEVRDALKRDGIRSGASMLVGGRVGAEPVKLFRVYDAGNAIECRPENPFLQIGEIKYGKPILDRALNYKTRMNEAAKIGLISFDSTMRSNLAVGLPIDMVLLRDHEGSEPVEHTITENDGYFQRLSKSWSTKLRNATASIERPDFVPMLPDDEKESLQKTPRARRTVGSPQAEMPSDGEEACEESGSDAQLEG